MGILSDDRARYDKGVRLYHATVADYLKWGKGSYAAGRILGETSETMRDMYHAQVGGITDTPLLGRSIDSVLGMLSRPQNTRLRMHAL